ncbi:unnamed protein product [Adineta steineri]|uniref:Formimidoyltransferase-cyclodeaminase n=1 Tax=Adineta steineri TaxID=433720 RepID=A0A814EDZ5_9BILA|nr:unnamed protein product [Adineta steineri]CAF3667303.1 unnamed protein product [Adineta steineri]
MQKVIECVPNFSEGQRKEVIDAIAHAISCIEDVSLLDIDSGVSTNRTIYIFVGHPRAVIEAAIVAARCAHNLIDMTKHTNEHPRIGVMDVVPFIPVRNATMSDCIDIALEFANRLASELHVPVYLYGEAQEKEYRRDLTQIRNGEYEALYDKLKKKEWQPDFRPSEFVPSWGATCVGARNYLITYNINLFSTKEQAHRIALNICEEGSNSNEIEKLKCIRGHSWWYDEGNLAQIAFNLIDFEVTNIHTVYNQCVTEAKMLNIGVCGSQILGIIPLKSLIMAADYFIEKENLFILEEDQKIRLVIDRLGLNSITPFNPKKRIMEYIIHEDESITSMKLKDIMYHIGSRTLIPGGNCVTSLVATLGAALGAMCALLTYGMRKWELFEKEMRIIITSLHTAIKSLMNTVDTNTEAFNTYLMVQQMTETTIEEKRFKKMTEKYCLEHYLDISLDVAQQINNLWEPFQRLAPLFNIDTKADFIVGIKCLETAVYGICKRIEFFSTSILYSDSQTEIIQNNYVDAAKQLLEIAQNMTQTILAVVETRN